MHLAIDDYSRLADSEILPDEKRTSCLRFLFNALSYSKTNGLAERFVQTSLREWAYARALRHIRSTRRRNCPSGFIATTGARCSRRSLFGIDREYHLFFRGPLPPYVLSAWSPPATPLIKGMSWVQRPAIRAYVLIITAILRELLAIRFPNCRLGLRISPPADNTGRCSDRYRTGGNRPRDHRACANDAAVPDLHARDHHNPCAKPDVVADDHVALELGLIHDRRSRLGLVVRRRDEDFGSQQGVVSEGDPPHQSPAQIEQWDPMCE